MSAQHTNPEDDIVEAAVAFTAFMLRTDVGTPFEVRAMLQPLTNACQALVKEETDAADREAYWHGESVYDAKAAAARVVELKRKLRTALDQKSYIIMGYS